MVRKMIVLCLAAALALPVCAFWGSGDTLKVTADTWVYQFKPNKNYGDGRGWADITDPTKSVTVPKMFLGFGGSDKKTVLLKFDTSRLKKDKPVKKATVCIYNDYAGSAASVKVAAKMISSAWDEMKVTYNTRPKTAGQVLSTLTVVNKPNKGQWLTWDVTAAVKAWQSGKANNGIMLDPQGEYGVDFDIIAREYKGQSAYYPKLEVSY